MHDVQGNNGCLLEVPNRAHDCAAWAKYGIFSVKPGGAYTKQQDLTF